MDDKTVAVKA